MRCPRCHTSLDPHSIVCPACGTDVAADGPSTAATAAREFERPDDRETPSTWPVGTAGAVGAAPQQGFGRSAARPPGQVKPWLVGLIAGVVGLVLMGITAVLVLARGDAGTELSGADRADTASEAEQTVLAFFAALAERDAGKAQSLVVSGLPEMKDNPLLSDRTLGHPGYLPPSDVQTKVIQPGAGTHTVATPEPKTFVQASFAAAGTRTQVQFKLVPGRGGSGADRWLIADPLLPLSVRSAASNTLIIAGTTFRVTGKIFVFPGAYIAALPPHPLIDAKPVTVPAGAIAMGVPLHARVHEGIEKEIEPQVRDYIDKCARNKEPDPDGCPFDMVPNYAYPLAVNRKIIEYPKLRVTRGSWSDVSVTTVTPGQVETRGPRPVSDSYPVPPIETITVTGSVKLVDGKVVFYPQK